MTLLNLDEFDEEKAKEQAKVTNATTVQRHNLTTHHRQASPSPKASKKYLLIGLTLLCLAAGGVAIWRFTSRSNDSNEQQAAAVIATLTPSMPPSLPPTFSQQPSDMPSSAPSDVPSSAPTVEVFVVEPNSVPSQRARSYFNYDANDGRFGPNRWRNIDMSGTYYQEFGAKGFGPWNGHLRFHVSNPESNRCDNFGKQSPIELERSKGVPGACTATHQIRTLPGVHRLQSNDIEKRIEPNKLRLLFPRRPCLNVKNPDCLGGRPPVADFPNYSSDETHYSDLLNLDIKVPGEHRMFNETFDAEIQMLHIHLTASRMAQIGVPIRATADGYNDKFQAVLDEFQLTYDRNAAECAIRQGQTDVSVEGRRVPSGTGRFDPYKDFMPDVFFYRYEGSNTEPPCMSMTWFVMTHPLTISLQQLRQIKRLIFTNVDATCQPTSVHNSEQSVARPLQRIGVVNNEERPVMLCKTGSFLPDDP